MIRPFEPGDADAIVAVWLSASEESHRFVDEGFWRARAADMRDVYLPLAETYVAVEGAAVVGFASLVGEELAALFVAPAIQRTGVGSELLRHVQRLRSRLTLAVYVANEEASGFYRRRGFRPISERVDGVTGWPETVMEWKRQGEDSP